MKAVIFDIDGTLVDSVDLHASAWQEAFEHFGHRISFDDIRAQIGKGGDQLMPVFLSREEVEKESKALEKFRGDLYKKKYFGQVRAFPQVRELFLRLIEDGWKVALASSAKGDELTTYKKIAGITDLVDEETSSDDAERSKPHPDIFQAAVERLKVAPDECIVIGDSPFDAEAASKAGIRSIGFLCGGFPAEDLTAAGFEKLYEGAADLLRNYEDSVFTRRAHGQPPTSERTWHAPSAAS
jgi:HAD superfamily hydrolase (TIGR01549 family)